MEIKRLHVISLMVKIKPLVSDHYGLEAEFISFKTQTWEFLGMILV